MAADYQSNCGGAGGVLAIGCPCLRTLSRIFFVNFYRVHSLVEIALILRPSFRCCTRFQNSVDHWDG
jgi:hypothetical protein